MRKQSVDEGNNVKHAAEHASIPQIDQQIGNPNPLSIHNPKEVQGSTTIPSKVNKNHIVPAVDPGDKRGEELEHPGESSLNELERGVQQKLNPVTPGIGAVKLALKDGVLSSPKKPVNPTGVVQKENTTKNLIPKPTKNQMVTQEFNDDEEQNQRAKGRDMDAESTAQNFMNVARQRDIFPRQMEK